MPRGRSKKKINVMLGELVKPLVTKSCDAGTAIEEFLSDNDVRWSSAVRVNGETVTKSYKLKNDDVITTIGSVSGGR